MKFHKAPSTPDLFLRVVDETNTIQIGIYRVMFGYRVRAGRVDDKFGVNLDWCGGDQIDNIVWLYNTCITILSQREPDNCFEGLPPVSQIKPAFNDKEFIKTLLLKIGCNPMIREFKFTQEQLDAGN